jgi:hypothetical protein
VAAAALGGTAAVSSTTFVPAAGEDTVVTASPSPSASAEASPEASPSPSADASADATESASPAPSLPPCTGEEKNHGAYVSSVAKDKSVTGREHGALVSAAAQSDCGKKAGEDADSSESAEDAESADDADAAEHDAADEDGEDGDDAARGEKKSHKHGRGNR